MKIWVTGTRGIPRIMGGVETHCSNLLPRLVSRGYSITVGCRKPYMNYNGKSYHGVALKVFKPVRHPGLEAISHTLLCVLTARLDNAVAVHIHAIGPALAVPLARLLGLKVIVTHHGFDYEREKWGKFARLMLRAGEYMALRYASHIIAVSPYIADTLSRRQCQRADIHFLPNGILRPSTRVKTQKTGNPYIFAAGRFVKEKGFHTLIEAYLRSGIQKRGIELIIAGDADTPTDYSRNLFLRGAAANVTMPGKISGIQMDRLMAGASLFLLPSTHEGLPIVLLEAMSHSLPVIVSDIPANHLPELPDNVFFQTGNIDELALKLKSFFNTPGPQKIHYDLSRYDWEHIADSTAEIYDSILNDKLLAEL